MKNFKEWFIRLCIIIYIPYTVDAKISGWVTDFGNYVQNNNKEHQVLLLFDSNDKSLNTQVEYIIREISERFPTLKVSFQEATNRKADELSKLPLFTSPRSTMVVIIHLLKDTEYMSELNRTINFVSNLSEPKRRSRSLIILPQEQKNFTYMNFLSYFWTKQFLDVTILELFEEKNGSYLKLSKEIAIIHQYNPFTKSYNKFRYTPTVPWFPDKTLNIHGYKMKVGLFPYPPLTFVEQSDKGELRNVFGADVELSKGLAKAMNFNIKWILPKNESSWGDSMFPKEKSTGHMYRIMHNKIQYIVSEKGRYTTAAEYLFETSRGTKCIALVIVVPILEEKAVQLLDTWKTINASMLIGLFLLIWILSHALHFDRRNWSLLNILLIVLGSSTPHEPRKLAERIVYGAMLLSCVLHSSYIFTAVTDVSLTVNSEMGMETIQDVISSTLRTEILDFVYPILYENAKESTRIFLNKSEVVVDYDRCFHDLMKKKNCSFVVRADIADWIIENTRDGLGRPLLKKVKESLKSTVSGLLMERRSPYVERFDQVLLRLIQCGLVDKWQRTRYNASLQLISDDTGFSRGSEFTLLQKHATYILLVGYAFAMIIFISEVLFSFLKRKIGGRLA